jgi:hypothetical protein
MADDADAVHLLLEEAVAIAFVGAHASGGLPGGSRGGVSASA